MNKYNKGFNIKDASGGADVTPEMLAKINSYALTPLTADKVYARKFLLAHNAVDRDRERFQEALLDDFAVTIPGKSFLFAHDGRNYLPLGLWFDASSESMTVEQFKSLTGEDALLPIGTSTVKVMFAWSYMLKSATNQDTMDNIDAGIYRHVSIRFSAADLVAVKGGYDETLYYEYQGPGEAEEGSLVWLGAQPGSTSQKGAKAAVSFAPTTAAPEDTGWDGAAATGRIAGWASSDGSGDKDKIDWGKYRRGFAWYDGENAEDFGAYKLPHHDISEGSLVVVWNGVEAAMGALLGARGGVDIPEEDKDAVYSHLSRHYEQFDRESPTKASSRGVNIKNKKLEDRIMKGVKSLLSLDADAGEGAVEKAVSNIVFRNKTLESIVAVIGEDATIESVKTLKAQSEDGAGYRKSLTDDALKYGALIGEVPTDGEKQKKEAEFLATWPIDRLKSHRDKFEAAARKEFPQEFNVKSKDQDDKNRSSQPEESPLIKDAKERAKRN